MKKFLGRNFLLTVSALALVASVVTGRERPTLELVEPRAASGAAGLDLSLLARAEVPAASADPFAPRSFEQAVPQKEVHRKAEKPVAPPLPFQYVGRMIDGDKIAVFLARGEESLSVSAGDTIAGEYRVDKVTESEVLFTYLPLKTKQSLPL